jgi:hypothetical protein
MVAIDTSSIKMTRNEIKAALKTRFIGDSGRTTKELQDICTMFENKYVRIEDRLFTMAGVTPESIALDAKNAKIKLEYFLIKQWLAGERP